MPFLHDITHSCKTAFSLRRFFKIFTRTLLGLVCLLALVTVLITLTPVQNWLARQAVGMLAKKLHTKVSLQHVRIDFLNHAVLEGLYLEDKKGDTLLYAGEARIRISDWFFLKKEKPVLTYVGLHHARVYLNRPAQNDVWNYQFIIDAFDTGPRDKTKKNNEIELDLDKLELEDVVFHMDDAWVGQDIDIAVGSFFLKGRSLDLQKRTIDLDQVSLKNAGILVRDYAGGRPKSTVKKKKVTDTTAFNKGGWLASVDRVDLENCFFTLETNRKPEPEGTFDAGHMQITNIAMQTRGLRLTGDTLRGRIVHMAANDKSGFQLNHLEGLATVSPILSELRELKIETPNSSLGDYYAMHYERFPDFEDYIHKVRMSGKLKNSTVAAKDVAYFAPALKQYPVSIKVSGEVHGRVDSLAATNFTVSDGTTGVRGAISMVGLPDINKTFIRYQGGQVFTTGKALMRYIPALQANDNIDLAQLQYIFYQGNFIGYINSFAFNGNIISNLGNIRSDIRMQVPRDAQQTAYAGTISTPGFQLGRLFHNPEIGNLAVSAQVSGSGFSAESRGIRVNALASSFTLHGYNYKNIKAEGTLSRKKFNGKLLVDDPNLGLGFYGQLDFSGKEPAINATANLLKSDLRALNLTRDSLTVVADFDLNISGSNMDNLLGTARLYNIDLNRGARHIDIDSVYLYSRQLDDGQELVVLESNDVQARLSGQFDLSTLHLSAQRFLYEYAPNYFSPPRRTGAAQDITFDIHTRRVDGLVALLDSGISGFSNSSLNGKLNTETQSLTFITHIPYGRIGATAFSDIAVFGEGNYARMNVAADFERLDIADSFLTLNVNMNSTIGHDSLSFRISSHSESSFNKASLNGNAYATGDSVYMMLEPSDFLLNKELWEIPAGAQAVVAPGWLRVQNLKLISGDQQIEVATPDTSDGQDLRFALRNLELSKLSRISASEFVADLAPAGQLNGYVVLRDLFVGMKIDARLKAANTLLGKDTLGDVFAVGTYNTRNQQLTLDGETGVYGKGGWISAKGLLSFGDSSVPLNATISLNQTPLHWVNPFVTGIMSGMEGAADGNVRITGTAKKPVINGTVQLSPVKLHIDYTGVDYTVAPATIKLTNDLISFDPLNITDRFGNKGLLSGSVTHKLFQDITFRLYANAPALEALNLESHENPNFYGHVIARVDAASISGPLENLRMSIQAAPAAESQLYIPITTSAASGSYNYVTFAKHGEPTVIKTSRKNRLSINIDVIANPLAEVSLILDPATGDEIRARGNGVIQMEIPAAGDIKIFGNYEITQGNYNFTFRQLFLKRNFVINSGSRIGFNGSFSQTELNVNATYQTRASLYELLTAYEKQSMPDKERQDAQRIQNVNVLLTMSGSLEQPDLSFKLDLPEKRSVGTYAYTKLEQINQSDRELFDQVASLLLIGYFIPPEGIESSAASSGVSGAVNNISEILSTTTSQQLTNIANKILGDPKLSIDFKYKNYNLNDGTATNPVNRNEIKLGFRRNFFDDRLIVELGTAYDWGRPSGSNTNSGNFNPVGDFRAQYLLSPGGSLRLNAFNTSDYDALVDKNITRRGIGISWRRSFDHISQLFSGKKKEVADTAKGM